MYFLVNYHVFACCIDKTFLLTHKPQRHNGVGCFIMNRLSTLVLYLRNLRNNILYLDYLLCTCIYTMLYNVRSLV